MVLGTMILLLFIKGDFARADLISTNTQLGNDTHLLRISQEIQNTFAKIDKVNSDITLAKFEIEQLNMEMGSLALRLVDREKGVKNQKEFKEDSSYLVVLLKNNKRDQPEQTLIPQQETEKRDFKDKKISLSKNLTVLASLQNELEHLQEKLPVLEKQYELFKIKKNQEAHIENLKVNTYASIVTQAGNKYMGRSVYVFGGGRNAHDVAMGWFDCSGFVHWAFAQAGIDIGFNTDSIKKQGKRVLVKDMKPGDIVFFDTYKKDGHVGIYLGNGKFIGSQCNTGVAIADMTQGYWKNAFKGHVIRI